MLKSALRLTVLLLTFVSLTSVSFGGDYLYVGVKKCKTCHNTTKSGKQYTVWSGAAHANALKSLSSPEALEYAKKNNIADPAKDPKCLNCHATMATVDQKLIDPKGKLTMEEGVSCESCHGPGSAYKKKSVMVDHEKSLANGLWVPDEKTCLTCHNKKNPFHKPFDFKKMVAKVSHPVPPKAPKAPATK